MFDELKSRHRKLRDEYPENLNLRIHRALSWLNAAETSNDIDGKFIFLWVAFNSAYSFEVDDRYRTAEQEAFNEFIGKLCRLDKSGKLEGFIWNEFPRAIRSLLKNQYIFPRFWDFQKGKLSDQEWQTAFKKANAAAHKALGARETEKVIGIILSRIYTLRNQLVHGGATWGGKVNRQQLQDCTQMMEHFIPIVIEVMIENPNTLWGEPCYPVVKS